MKHCGNCQWSSENVLLSKEPLTEHVHLFLFTKPGASLMPGVVSFPVKMILIYLHVGMGFFWGVLCVQGFGQ